MFKPNPEQKKAIEKVKGPVLIIAGPGTGKTFVITEKIKFLINKKKVNPENILALTFTEKAAREMEERVDKALPYGYFQINTLTFHSFADSILRDSIYNIGLPVDYKLLTEPEAILFFRNNLFKFNLNYFRPLGNPTKFVSALLRFFSRLKDEYITPEEYLSWVEKKTDWQSKEEREKHIELATTYRDYQILKIEHGFMDFGDLLFYLIELFKKRKNVLSHYRKEYPYILVDEFQDTNLAQYEIIKLLAPPESNPNLTVVGDDSQAIYKFRGASVSNILNFMEDYKNAELITLKRNYRSYQEILDRSYQLIQKNNPDTLEAKLGISKALISMQEESKKGIVSLIISKDEFEEAERVVDEVERLTKREGIKLSEIAILARANSHLEAFMKALTQRGIPYQLGSSGKLFRKPEIKDLIAYLSFLTNPEDSLSLYRVLSMDIFGLDPIDLKLLISFSDETKLSLFETIRLYLSFYYKEFEFKEAEKYKPYLKLIKKETLKKLRKIMKLFQSELRKSLNHSAISCLYDFIEKTGYLQKLSNYETEKDEQRALNIAKFFNFLKDYEVKNTELSVQQALDLINLSLEFGDSPNAFPFWDEPDVEAVNLLTVHSAKGLEFDVVFIVNLVKQRFPTRKQREKIEIPEELVKEILPEGDYHTQEERRLFYVALTRARKRLYLTAARYYLEGKRERVLSPFVHEILSEKEIESSFKEKKESPPQLSLFSFKPGIEDQWVKQKILNKNFSFSQLSVYQTCPLQYKYQYILKLPVPLNAATSFGTTIHRTLYRFYKDCGGNKDTEVDNLIKIFDQEWIPVGYSSKEHQKRMKKEGKRILINFYNQFHKSGIKILALEKNFKIKIEGKVITGKIDRVDALKDGEIEIIDYKTGSMPDERKLRKSFQLSIYALAASQSHTFNKSFSNITLSFIYLNEGKKISFKKESAEIEETKQKILDTISKIEALEFEPKVGPHCDFCPFRILCPAWQ